MTGLDRYVLYRIDVKITRLCDIFDYGKISDG